MEEKKYEELTEDEIWEMMKDEKEDEFDDEYDKEEFIPQKKEKSAFEK